jgi:hypothetical protein
LPLLPSLQLLALLLTSNPLPPLSPYFLLQLLVDCCLGTSSTESMILSACTESIIHSQRAALRTSYSQRVALRVGVAPVKSPKIIYDQSLFLVDVQGIYANKIDPKFHTQKIPGSAPLGASTFIFMFFVSDWTRDSHLTHFLSSKRRVFSCTPKQ